MDGRIMRCAIIGSCLSAATSDQICVNGSLGHVIVSNGSINCAGNTCHGPVPLDPSTGD